MKLMGKIGGWIMVALMCGGCASSSSKFTTNENYFAALNNTGRLESVKKEREDPKIERFCSLYEAFTAEKIFAMAGQVYAEDAYFRDPFKEVIGLDAIRDYFMHSTEAFESCRFDIQDVVESDGEYYVRWVMYVQLKNYAEGETLEGVGMTHLRFDDSGKVILHQDYFDSSVIYERLPLIGALVRKVKARM